MPQAARPADEGYIEVGYEDKVVFAPKKKAKRQLIGVSDELRCRQTLRR
jgi:hypothetical protein